MTVAYQKFLAELEDPACYARRPDITVFDVHDRTDEDKNGKKTVTRFTKSRLEQIARQSNRRDQGGTPCPLTLGHTIPGAPETDQPDIVGYARHFKTVWNPTLKKWVIAATYYIRRDSLAEAQKYPRSSVELWPGELVLDPIALLKRTPQRDLGQWTYARSSRHGDRRVYRYSMETAAMALDPTSPPDANDPDQEFSDKVMQCVRTGYPHLDDMHSAHEATLAPPVDGDGIPDGEAPEPLDTDGDGIPNGLDPEPFAAAPSGTNTFVSGGADGDPKTRFARQGQALQYERKEKAKAQGKVLRLERQLKYSRELQQLERGGYAFDFEVELADSLDMNEAQFGRHKDRLIRHGKAPVGGQPVRVAPSSAEHGAERGKGEPKRYSREEVEKVIAYQAEHGCSYEEALAQHGKPTNGNGKR